MEAVALDRGVVRLALLSSVFLALGACLDPVCDALLWECPAASAGPDAGTTRSDSALDGGGTDGGIAPDAAAGPDAGSGCVPGTWEVETITTLGREGWPRAAADFAVDPDGEVHLAFSDGASRYYARRSRSGWTALVLLGDGFWSPPTGSIALGPARAVQAVWGDELYAGAPISVGELLPGAGWTRTTLDRCPRFGCGPPSLATDSAGAAHLAYVRPMEGEAGLLPWLQYAVRLPGGAWSESEFVAEECAFEVALAIGPDGPHLAYLDPTSVDLKHAVRVDGTWRVETVRQRLPTQIVPTLAVDDAGGVHIGYVHFADMYGRHGYAHRPAGGAWVLEEKVGAHLGSLWTSPSIATHAGEIRLALQTAASVAVARRGATGWVTEQVASLADDTLSRDRGAVLRVDSRGGLHLVYPNWGSGTLVYARQCPSP